MMRQATWVSRGEATTVDALQQASPQKTFFLKTFCQALAGTFPQLVFQGIAYASEDMKLGVCAAGLAKVSETLKAFVSLDARRDKNV